MKFSNLTLVGISFPLVSSFSLKVFQFPASFISSAVVSTNFLSNILSSLYMDIEVQRVSGVFLTPSHSLFLSFYSHSLKNNSFATWQIPKSLIRIYFSILQCLPQSFPYHPTSDCLFLGKIAFWCQEENKISESIVSVLTWKVLFASLRTRLFFFFSFKCYILQKNFIKKQLAV